MYVGIASSELGIARLGRGRRRPDSKGQVRGRLAETSTYLIPYVWIHNTSRPSSTAFRHKAGFLVSGILTPGVLRSSPNRRVYAGCATTAATYASKSVAVTGRPRAASRVGSTCLAMLGVPVRPR